MRTLLIAAASALFFAYAVTELSMRLWPGDYFPQLIVAFAALLVSGLLNLKLAGLFGAHARPRGHQSDARAREVESRNPRPSAQRADKRDDQRARTAGSGGRGNDDSRSHRGTERTPAADDPERVAARPPRTQNADAPPEPAPPAGPREQGTVKWFNRTKGFGFVIRESGEEIFVHQRSVRMIEDDEGRRRPALKDGQAVTFVVAEREKGLQAEDVTPADDA